MSPSSLTDSTMALKGLWKNVVPHPLREIVYNSDPIALSTVDEGGPRSRTPTAPRSKAPATSHVPTRHWSYPKPVSPSRGLREVRIFNVQPP